jgi:hypothetical protein
MGRLTAESVAMPEGAEEPQPSESTPASTAPAATPATATSASAAPPKGRMLLPYCFANLAVIYLPSLLPLALEVYRKLDEEIGIDRRSIAIDALSAPWAGLRFVLPRDVYSLSAWLGNAGSLYAFLLTLWFGTLFMSVLYCNTAHRYRLTFVLFVLSTVQAIFVADRFVSENHQPPPVQQQQPAQLGAD